MKLLPTLVLAFAAAACGAAGAASYNSDQDRRDQNREEALSKWRAQHGDLAAADNGMRRSSMRAKAHHGASAVREETHEGARAVRKFTHRQAEKARNFSERQDRRYGKKHAPINTSPEGGGR